MVKFDQVCTVAGADTDSKRPLMGELISGFLVLSDASKLREPPNQFVLHRAFCIGSSYAGSGRTARYGGCLIRRGVPRSHTPHCGCLSLEQAKGIRSRATVKQPARIGKSGERLIPSDNSVAGAHSPPSPRWGRGSVRRQTGSNLVAGMKGPRR
jgi:hypothetical protein